MIIILTLFALTLALSQLLHVFSVPTEISRKSTHILGAFLAILASLTLGKNEFVLTSFIVISFLFYTKKKNLLPSVHNVERETYGVLLFPIGILITYLLAGNYLTNFQIAILILGLADSIAALTGIYLLKSKKKSLGGSVAFFACTLFILYFFLYHYLDYNPLISISLLLFISLLMAVVEKYSNKGLDNLFLPLLSFYASLVIF